MTILRLDPERAQRSPVTGRYLPGHLSPNKGKTWDELGIGKRARKRMSQGWKNLDQYRSINGRLYGGRKRRSVVCIDGEGNWTVFRAIGDAAEKLQCRKENIRRCCEANRRGGYVKDVGNHDCAYIGLRWYFEEDGDLWNEKV